MITGAAPGDRPMRVLVADDEPSLRLVARLALKRAGFEVYTADSGASALVQVATVAPDVILLDWMMPELDGPSTCARLKADASTQGIPVIFLSAQSEYSEMQRGLALGALGYITKPFDAATLGARVRQLLRPLTPRAPDGPVGTTTPPVRSAP